MYHLTDFQKAWTSLCELREAAKSLSEPDMKNGYWNGLAGREDGSFILKVKKAPEKMHRVSFMIMRHLVKKKKLYEKSIKGLHILLAEDNELNMEIAEFMLQNEGADVTKAWNGQEAVELFRKSEPGEFDVILMDIMMPVMNGYEATKMIRSLDREEAKEVPIIAMTANAFTEDRIRAKEAGMDEHVAKPVDVELLIKVIHKLVG